MQRRLEELYRGSARRGARWLRPLRLELNLGEMGLVLEREA